MTRGIYYVFDVISFFLQQYLAVAWPNRPIMLTLFSLLINTFSYLHLPMLQKGTKHLLCQHIVAWVRQVILECSLNFQLLFNCMWFELDAQSACANKFAGFLYLLIFESQTMATFAFLLILYSCFVCNFFGVDCQIGTNWMNNKQNRIILADSIVILFLLIASQGGKPTTSTSIWPGNVFVRICDFQDIMCRWHLKVK